MYWNTVVIITYVVGRVMLSLLINDFYYVPHADSCWHATQISIIIIIILHLLAVFDQTIVIYLLLAVSTLKAYKNFSKCVIQRVRGVDYHMPAHQWHIEMMLGVLGYHLHGPGWHVHILPKHNHVGRFSTLTQDTSQQWPAATFIFCSLPYSN